MVEPKKIYSDEIVGCFEKVVLNDKKNKYIYLVFIDLKNAHHLIL